MRPISTLFYTINIRELSLFFNLLNFVFCDQFLTWTCSCTQDCHWHLLYILFRRNETTLVMFYRIAFYIHAFCSSMFDIQEVITWFTYKLMIFVVCCNVGIDDKFRNLKYFNMLNRINVNCTYELCIRHV